MDESTIVLSLEVEPGPDVEEVARQVQEEIAGLGGVAEADAAPDNMRIAGAEVIAIIAVAVVVVRGVREAAQEINALMPEIARIIRNFKGIRTGYVEIDGKRVPLAEVGEQEIDRLANG
ncbi:hypothetical protein OHA21_12920 [Actinoplanes sp. NBC_00393]|uniref:hypothetical protein n=1 Tax=Actinoplanes sp. NBC_00393 TaxID=2975953 RepID=UPI002E20FF63